jgi:hypothetical protein
VHGHLVGFHYDSSEDQGLFWSNDRVAAFGEEGIDFQQSRNRRLQPPGGKNDLRAPRTSARSASFEAALLPELH